MHKSIKTTVAGAAIAGALSAPAQAGSASWSSGGGGGGLLMIPIACAVILPWIKSAKLRRELTGPEISATTLTCFAGPLGFYIATEKGWIGPDFFRHNRR